MNVKKLCLVMLLSCGVAGMLAACSGTPDSSNNSNTNQNKPPERRTDTGTPSRAEDAKFTEPETKVEFQGYTTVRGSENKHFFMGTGLRTKTILQIKIYVIGFYIDVVKGREELKPWNTKSVAELQKDTTFYDKLLNGAFGKSLRLVMVYSVDKKTMADAFAESLQPRIDKMEGATKEAAMKDLETFKGFFDKDLVDKDEIKMIWLDDGTLHAEINGELKGTIKNADFAKALFDVYLGAEPISEGAKKDFASGMSDLY
ncbi:MAG: hypothetical protein EP343_03740 [Deltaproteobacteria bacterium]|nr:MAG: hypothetical protein EP343_03740 [Deltaproteobacteria bacterium]